MIPDASWWLRLLAMLAAEALLVVGVAAGLGRFVRGAQLRRVVWQACFLSVAVVWGAEIAGLREQVPQWKPSAPGNRRVVVQANQDPTLNVIPSVAPSVPAAPAFAPAPSKAPGPLWWPGFAWMAGALFIGLRLLAGRTCLWWRCRRADSGNSRAAGGDADSSADTAATVERLRQPLSLGRVRLLRWRSLRGPVAFGVLRPTIALPVDFESRFDASQRAAMLAHELAHLAARDPLWLLVADVIWAAAWWHPGLWWARRRLHAAAEAAADEASALVPGGRFALAESLVQFGRELVAEGGIGVGGSGRGSDLSRRVATLLDENAGNAWRRCSRIRTVMAQGAGICLAAMLAVIPSAIAIQTSPLRVVAAAVVSAPVGSSSPASPVDAASKNPQRSHGANINFVAPSDAVENPVNLFGYTMPQSPGIKSEWMTFTLEENKDLPKGPVAARLFQISFSKLMATNHLSNGTDPLYFHMFEVPYRRHHLMGTGLVTVQAPEYELNQIELFLMRTGTIETPGIPQSANVGAGDGVSMSFQFAQNSKDDVPAGGRAGNPAPEDTERPRRRAENRAGVPQIQLLVQILEVHRSPNSPDPGIDLLFGSSTTNHTVTTAGPPTGDLPGALSPYALNFHIDHLVTDGQWVAISKDKAVALLEAMRNTEGVDLLSAPRLITLSGRQAQVAVQEEKSIVTGPAFHEATATNKAAVVYGTEKMGFGPTVDLLPTLTNGLFRLATKARYTEFGGYAEPAKGTDVVGRDENGHKLTGKLSLPVIRVRDAVAEAACQPGEQIVLRGPRVSEVMQMIDKVPVLGDLPLLGGLFTKRNSQTNYSQIYLIIEPIEVDGSGRPAAGPARP